MVQEALQCLAAPGDHVLVVLLLGSHEELFQCLRLQEEIAGVQFHQDFAQALQGLWTTQAEHRNGLGDASRDVFRADLVRQQAGVEGPGLGPVGVPHHGLIPAQRELLAGQVVFGPGATYPVARLAHGPVIGNALLRLCGFLHAPRVVEHQGPFAFDPGQQVGARPGLRSPMVGRLDQREGSFGPVGPAIGHRQHACHGQHGGRREVQLLEQLLAQGLHVGKQGLVAVERLDQMDQRQLGMAVAGLDSRNRWREHPLAQPSRGLVGRRDLAQMQPQGGQQPHAKFSRQWVDALCAEETIALTAQLGGRIRLGLQLHRAAAMQCQQQPRGPFVVRAPSSQGLHRRQRLHACVGVAWLCPHAGGGLAHGLQIGACIGRRARSSGYSCTGREQ